MKLSRRHFLKSSIAASGLSLVSTKISAFEQPEIDDYKALVCIFLYGGNDAYNMVVPTSANEYRIYHKARPQLALTDAEILPLSFQSDNGVSLGLHHSMQSLMPFMASGEASVILNSGQLLAPSTRSSIQSGAVQVPQFLMSHNSQQDMWQTGATNIQNRFGWAGRMADMMGLSGNLSPLIAINDQTRLTTAEFRQQTVVSSNGAGTYSSWDYSARLDGYFEHFVGTEFENIYMQHFADVMKQSVNENNELKATLDQHPSTMVYPDTKLGDQLKMVSRLIQARNGLAQKRQIFCVGIGGFDTHFNQKPTHERILSEVADAMACFQTDINQLGLGQQIVSTTMSDFGRRVMANASGSDHGWAGHQIVMGGAVKGHRAYGQWPDLNPNSENDYSSGRIIPTIAADQVHASLCQWFGLSMANIYELFPNLIHFDSPVIDFV